MNITQASLAHKIDQDKTYVIIRSVGSILIFLGVRFLLFHIIKLIYMSRHSHDFKESLIGLSNVRVVLRYLNFVLNERNVFYYSWYLTFAILGVTLHVFFFAFHLYEIMNQFKTCRIFIQSIINPWRQLVLAFVFYNILIYEYAVLAYYFFWEWFVDSVVDDNPHHGYYCDSMYVCYLTVYDQVNKEPGGVGSYLDFFDETAFMKDNYRSLYDITFKFTVVIIMLSIVKGIIVDTFGALREEDQEKTEDMEGKCYMCGIERESFDKIRTKTFVVHIKQSHNMWDYVYFLVYLGQKSRTELNGEELYVYENFEKAKYDWVPNKRCLEIDDTEEVDFNENLKDSLDVVKAKMRELEGNYTGVAKSLGKYLKTRTT